MSKHFIQADSSHLKKQDLDLSIAAGKRREVFGDALRRATTETAHSIYDALDEKIRVEFSFETFFRLLSK
jgi:hypothetical protein